MKKEIEFIAKVLNSARPEYSGDKRQWTRTVEAFSEALAQENPRFNLGKFERACETGEGIRPRETA